MQRVQPSPNLKATVREGAKEIYVAAHRKGHDVKGYEESVFVFQFADAGHGRIREFSSSDLNCPIARKGRGI